MSVVFFFFFFFFFSFSVFLLSYLEDTNKDNALLFKANHYKTVSDIRRFKAETDVSIQKKKYHAMFFS